MGTAHTPDILRGLGVPDVRLAFWAAESGEYDGGGVRLHELECASPIAGIAEPEAPTEMALRASGEQSADIEAHCVRSGLPCLDEVGLLWKPTADADDDLRGRDLPVVPFRWEPIHPTGTRGYPHILRLDDDSVLECCQVVGTGLETRRRNTDGSWDAAQTVHVYAAADILHPCLLQMPGASAAGRVHLYFWLASGSDWQIAYYHSADRGVTWTYGGVVLLATVSGAALSDVRRIRAAYCNGQVLLVAHLEYADTATAIYRDRLIQWASSDGGHLFQQVMIHSGADESNMGAYPDLCVIDDQFLLGYVVYNTVAATCLAQFVRLASAWMALTSEGYTGRSGDVAAGLYVGDRDQPGGAGHDYLISDGELALWSSDDTAVYCALRRCDVGGAPIYLGACVTLRSVDAGETWSGTGTGLFAGLGQTWHYADGDDTVPTQLAACEQRGRALIACNWLRATVDQTNIGIIYLGGWQSRPMPPDGGILSAYRRTAFQPYPQIALALPDEQGWTLTTGGAPAISYSSARVAIVTAAAPDAVAYTRSGALFTPAQGAIFELACEITAGLLKIFIEAYDAAPLRYASEIRVTPTTIQLWDSNAGPTQIGATLNYTGGRVRLRLDQTGATVVAAAFLGNDTLEDRKWNAFASGAALTNAGAYVVDRIGISVAADTTCWLDEWPLAYGAFTGDHTFGQTKQSKMPSSIVPGGVWLGAGVRASAVSGPAVSGDVWGIARTWEYPPEALLPRVTPSPRAGWRSRPLADMDVATTEVRVSFSLDSADTHSLGKLLVAFLDRCNFSGGELRLYYAGAWHLVASRPFWSFSAERRGSTVESTGGGVTDASVWRRDELVGAMVEFVSGGGPTSDYQMRCIGNAPGYVDTALIGASVPLQARLSGVNLAAPAAPTVRVWPSRGLVVTQTQTYHDEIRGVQLAIPVDRVAPYASPGAPPPEGYLECGCLAFGAAWLWGLTYSWGRRLERASGTQLLEAEDGTRTAYEAAPTREGASLGWSEGVPLWDYEMSDDPDYVTAAAGGPPVAFWADAPLEVADQLLALAASRTPVVYLPRIDRGMDGWFSSRRARGAWLGRIVSDRISLDSVGGEECQGEVLRLQSLDLDEEL